MPPAAESEPPQGWEDPLPAVDPLEEPDELEAPEPVLSQGAALLFEEEPDPLPAPLLPEP